MKIIPIQDEVISLVHLDHLEEGVYESNCPLCNDMETKAEIDREIAEEDAFEEEEDV